MTVVAAVLPPKRGKVMAQIQWRLSRGGLRRGAAMEKKVGGPVMAGSGNLRPMPIAPVGESPSTTQWPQWSALLHGQDPAIGLL